MIRGVEPFVRGTLGCQCPDEVFEAIESGPLRVVNLPTGATRLLIGRRLLIYLVHDVSEERAIELVTGLLAHGRAERDAQGYNRLRLVLAAADPHRVLEVARTCFEIEARGDERLHLHVVSRDQLPAGV
jgi:hypothetical protein